MLPYEKLAMAGEEMPDGLEYSDQILFLELRMLYDQYKKGIIDKPIAVREKKRLLDNYRVYQFHERALEEWVKQIRLSEQARAAYRKDRTLENADKLVALFEGGTP